MLVAENPTLVFVIEAGKGEARSQAETAAIDFRNVLALPKNSSVVVSAHTPVLKFVTLCFHDLAFDDSGVNFNIPEQNLKNCFTKVSSFPRTGWVNELCHRYTFERSIAQAPTSRASRFLEAELLKEFYYLSTNELDANRKPFFSDFPDVLQRALTFLEQNLHEDLNAAQIASAAATSRPTLVRLFHKHLAETPIKYLWNRRLDEGDKLLLTRKYTVSEVSALLGFSEASVSQMHI